MASVIAGTPFKSSTAAQSYSITVPSSSENDVLFLFCQTQNQESDHLEATGWTQVTFVKSTVQRNFAVLAKVASASEPTTVSLEFGNFASDHVIVHPYKVSGTDTDLSKIDFISGVNNGFGGGQYDPLSLTSDSGNVEHVWFCLTVVSGELTAGPSSYNSELTYSDLVSPVMGLGTAYRVLTAETEDPGAFAGPVETGNAYLTLAIPSAAGASTPEITDVDGGTTFTPGATNTLNGTNLSTSGGSIVIDGVTQTITNRAATAIEFTGVRGGNPYNQNLTLTYTDASSNTATLTVQQTEAADEFAVTAASPNNSDPASFWAQLVDTVTGDPITFVDGDQGLAYDFASLSTAEHPFNIDGTGNITAGNEGMFKVIFWLASEGTWGPEQTVTLSIVAELPSTVFKKLRKSLVSKVRSSLKLT